MSLPFFKMHGIGNDYVYVDAFTHSVENPARLAKEMSDRHRGIGSDGLILLAPSDHADFRMIMYNSDGSEGAMCGNGLRCLAFLARHIGRVAATEMLIETANRTVAARILSTVRNESIVQVDLGEPILDPGGIPLADRGCDPRELSLAVLGEEITGCAVSMGNPHFVVIAPQYARTDSSRFAELGAAIEVHPLFPKRTNVEFLHVETRKSVRQRTWERGAGETMACGSGAAASVVACSLLGLTDRQAVVKLRGGELHVNWSEDTNRVLQTGPAELVFEGVWPD